MTDSITAKDRAEFKHPNLEAALAAFQAEAPKVVKDATAKVTGENAKTGERVKYTYGYADLATVTEALNPILGKHGLAFSSKPTLTGQGFGLVYALKHESGEIDPGFWPLPDPTQTKPQDMGSWITYWRRYAFLAITNTFPSGEDDDGAQASSRESWDNAQPRQRQAQQEQPPKEQQKPPAKDWSKATDAEVHEQHTKLGNLELEQAGKLYDWMAKAGIHNRKVNYVGGDMLDATQVLAFRLADLAAERGIKAPEVAAIRDFAEGRGLMKVLVTGDSTLGEELGLAHAVAEGAEEAAEDLPPATGTD